MISGWAEISNLKNRSIMSSLPNKENKEFNQKKRGAEMSELIAAKIR
jgi:hypothetical protein